MNNYIILLFFTVVFSMIYAGPPTAFGHGQGSDTTPSIVIGDKEISVTVGIPSYDDNDTNERQITITAKDKQTNENVPNVTYLVGLFYDGEMIFRNYFFTDTGHLSMNVKSSSDDTIQIHGKQDSLLGAWYSTADAPLEITGPVFESAGLYTFEIQLRTIVDPTNVIEGPDVYTADVTINEIAEFIEQDKENNDVQFKTKSYFDTIDSFHYDPIDKVVTFEMPFDWSERQISHVPIVHTEVRFPKYFVDFLTPSYSGQVNGIELFKSSISIDDYTDDSERTVHFILLNEHLQYIKNKLQSSDEPIGNKMVFTLITNPEIDFPVSAWTRDESFQIDLFWDPLEIIPEEKTKFIFTIRDSSTAAPLRNSHFDFVILQNGQEIYRESKNAQIGGDFVDYTFAKDQTGPTSIRFEDIRGSGQSTEFAIVVVPEFGLVASLLLVVGMTFVAISRRKHLSYGY